MITITNTLVIAVMRLPQAERRLVSWFHDNNHQYLSYCCDEAPAGREVAGVLVP